MIKFSCKNCGQRLNVDDKHSGRKVKCPKCSSITVVPGGSDKITFHCENCGQKISVPQIHAGKRGKCPKCQNVVTIPGREAITAASGTGSSISQQNQYFHESEETQEYEGTHFPLILIISGAALVVVVAIVLAIFLRPSARQPDIYSNRGAATGRNSNSQPVSSNVSIEKTTYPGSSSAQQTTQSETLLARLPDDILGFIFAGGTDNLGPDFEKTTLSQILNDPSLQGFYQPILNGIWPMLNQQIAGSGLTDTFEVVKNFISLAATRPIIIGAAQKQSQGGFPLFGLAVLDAGTRKDEISKSLAKLEGLARENSITELEVNSIKMHGPMEPGGIPGYWGWVGNYLVFAINDGDGLAIKYLQDNSKRQTSNYIEPSSEADDAFALYLNFEKVLNQAKALVTMGGPQAEFAMVENVFSQLGLDKIKTITTRAGFVDSGLVFNNLIDISQPCTGLFADFRAINPDTFNMVSADASSFTAMNFDIAGIYDTIMNAIKSATGSNSKEFEQGISMIESLTGVKIRQGLLESLDGRIVFYQLAGGGSSLQSGQGGFVIIAGLKNAGLWQDSIAVIGKFAAGHSNGSIQVSTQEVSGRTLNIFAIAPLTVAQIMPAWTIVGENLVIGSNPTICNNAVEQIASANAQSIRSVESFRKATENLPSNLISFQYTDSKVQLAQVMAVLQQLWPVAAASAGQQGITLPMVLPDISNMIKDVAPSVQYSWLDEKGIHSVYRGAGIEPGLAAIGGGAAGIGILLPALARTREVANRMTSATNLSAIGKAMLIYANDYRDEFPPNLDELVTKCGLNPKVFESSRKPADFDGPTYIYITGQTTSHDPGNILVYENPGYCSDGLNVLYIDSHVLFVTKDVFMRDLRATYQRLGRQMPEIKFKN